MAEVQIDNSLEFWQPKDILLVTNFPYKYHGVKAMVAPDDLYCEADATGKATKINVIISLLERGLLPELTWFHDLDAFQLQPIEMTLDRDLGFTYYEWKPQWNTGSFFFKKGALNIFRWIKEVVYEYQINEEPALGILTKKNINNINSLYRKLNVTYNIGRRNTRTLISLADKPIKVVHFPPHYRQVFEKFKPYLTERLIKLIEEKYYQ